MKFNLVASMKNAGSKMVAGAKTAGAKYGPTGLMVVSVLAGAGALGYAIYATATKAKPVTEKFKEDVTELAQDKKNGDISEKEYKKEVFKVYRDATLGYVKVYWPVMAMEAISIVTRVEAHAILKKQNAELKKDLAATILTLNTVTKDFADYRAAVVEEEGEEKDRHYRFKSKKESVTYDAVDPETGEAEERTVEDVDVVDLDQWTDSPYMYVYDSKCWGYNSWNMDYSQAFLIQLQNQYNDKLQARGYVFLEEILNDLHITPKPTAHNAGWFKGEGDNYIDFRIFEAWDRVREDKRAGREPIVILDFNCQGRIDHLVWPVKKARRHVEG